MENDEHPGQSSELAQLGATRFGERVRDLRKARGLSQEALARWLSAMGRSFHQTTVAKLESGSRPTSVEELYLLAAVLDVEVGDFFISDSDAEVHNEMASAATEAARLADELAATAERKQDLESKYAAAKERYDELSKSLTPGARLALKGGEHG